MHLRSKTIEQLVEFHNMLVEPQRRVTEFSGRAEAEAAVQAALVKHRRTNNSAAVKRGRVAFEVAKRNLTGKGKTRDASARGKILAAMPDDTKFYTVAELTEACGFPVRPHLIKLAEMGWVELSVRI